VHGRRRRVDRRGREREGPRRVARLVLRRRAPRRPSGGRHGGLEERPRAMLQLCFVWYYTTRGLMKSLVHGTAGLGQFTQLGVPGTPHASVKSQDRGIIFFAGVDPLDLARVELPVDG
jgi:hypothetical protein